MWSSDFGQLVEGRVAVDLVFHRVEVHRLVARVAGDDLVGAHHPHAGAFLAPRVDVARQLDRHLRVGGVQAAAVLVVEARLAAHEDFPQRPFGLRRRSARRRPATCRCGSCRLPHRLLLGGMRQRRLAHPGAVVPGLDAGAPGARGCTGRRRRRRARTRSSRSRRSRSGRAPRSTSGRGRAASRRGSWPARRVASTNFWRRSSLLIALDAPAHRLRAVRATRRRAGRTS